MHYSTVLVETKAPFSLATKELVKDRKDGGVWEEMGLVELAGLNSNICAHVQVDMLAPIQDVLLLPWGQKDDY